MNKLQQPNTNHDELSKARPLTPREAAAYLHVSKSYLDKLRCHGGGPEYVRLSPRKVLYRKPDLDAWVRQRRYGSTSEYESE